MKPILAFVVFIFLIPDFAQGQTDIGKIKLDKDSLAALIPGKEGRDKIDALILLSKVIFKQNTDSSINLSNQAISLSENLNYKKGMADAYYNLGDIYYMLDSLEPTISNYLKALHIYEDIGPSQEFVNLLMQLGWINMYKGRTEYACKYMTQAKSIKTRLSKNELGPYIFFSLGRAKTDLGEYDSAYYYLNKAVDASLANKGKVGPWIYISYDMLYARQYYETNDTAFLWRAISGLEKALKGSIKDDNILVTIYIALAEDYMELNTEEHLSTSIEYLKMAERLADTSNLAYEHKDKILITLAWIYNIQGDYDRAIELCMQSLHFNDERMAAFSMEQHPAAIISDNNKFSHRMNKRKAYKCLYDNYAKLGDYKTAHEYYVLARQADDELYSVQNSDLLTMLEATSKEEKMEKQLALLAKDNELNKMKVIQSRIYLISMGGGVLILVLISLLFIRQRKTRVIIREHKLLHDIELKDVESKKLRELDQLKSRFFANISHEFRTPLTLIMGPLEKLLSKAVDNHDIKELGIAKKYAGKLQILINNLLTISKLESGKMELHASETNIVKLLETYMQSFESLAKQKNIELQFVSDNKELKAYIDREKFEQVLNNLLSNAFKFTGEGGVIKVEVCTKQSSVGSLPDGKAGMQYAKSAKKRSPEIANCQLPTANSENGCTEIKISDTGRGISPQHINHIFDRFYQVSNEDNSYYEGTGIGLALTRELVELHHGNIEVESNMGKGSVFTIFLPLGKDHLKPEEICQHPASRIQHPASSIQHPGSSIQHPASSTDQPILLIVEDNTDLRSYIREYFEKEFQIIEAIDGKDGYEKSSEHIPDIIISDVMMPKMDGIEFCKKIKTDGRTSHIPVILLTARVSKESRIEGLKTGADDFITKPFDGDELQVRVQNLIDQRKQLSVVLERKIQNSHFTSKLDLKDCLITSMDDKLLQKAKEVIEENLSNPEYSIEDFASAMALSRSQLHRKLKALINSSGSEFIRTIRLNYATGLLQKKAGTIAEIAYDSGFNNPTYFSQLFRQKFGMSPSEYQNNIED